MDSELLTQKPDKTFYFIYILLKLEIYILSPSYSKLTSIQGLPLPPLFIMGLILINIGLYLGHAQIHHYFVMRSRKIATLKI